jgi:hypothetical protein
MPRPGQLFGLLCHDAMTLSQTTLIMVDTIVTLSLSIKWHYGECHILNVIMLNVVMLNVIMLNIIMLNIIMLNVIMLNVVIPKVIVLNVTILNVVMLNVVRLNVIILNVVMLIVVMLNVVMLNVVAHLSSTTVKLFNVLTPRDDPIGEILSKYFDTF